MAYITHNKHYKTGDAAPPAPAKDTMRVYGMKFCPFVHRLKLVMHACGADHETINCNLTNKPEWIFDKNPRGTVPIIEENGEIIYESDITSRYILDRFGKTEEFITKDPLVRAKEEILLGDLVKGFSGLFVYGKAKDDEGRAEGIKKIEEALNILNEFLTKSKKPFIGGDKANYTDFMFWPMLQRFGLRHKDLVIKNPTVSSYYEKMLTNESVKACKHPDELETKFWEMYMTGGVANYDIMIN